MSESSPETGTPAPGEIVRTIMQGKDAAAALKHIARDERIKAYLQNERPVHDALLGAALRFIGGENLDNCVDVVKRFNRNQQAVTIDYMGESTRDKWEAGEATREFLRVVEVIGKEQLDASVSLDLSHIGLAVDPELAFTNASSIAVAAQAAGLEVMVSMEGSERTTEVLDLYRWLSALVGRHVGITLQAYLHRTPDDLKEMLELPGKIRIVKGAFEESWNVALPRGESLDSIYFSLVTQTLSAGHPLSVATHDLDILERVHRYLEHHDHTSESVEFEILKGVETGRLEKMAVRGYRTRVYVPYGVEWFLYLCHRLAEYPPNIYRAIVDAVTHSLQTPM